MAKYNYKILDLDVDKLFEERSVNEILEIEKAIDVEIEKKRTELRSMVGDRYKDILTASDKIKSMKDISMQIIGSIGKIRDKCEFLVNDVNMVSPKPIISISPEQREERAVAIQIRLTIVLNEQIWVALDHEDYCKAAQFYLLAQHVHTGLQDRFDSAGVKQAVSGLRLVKKDILEKIPLLKRIRDTVEMLRETILNRVGKKLQTLSLTAEETSSNLNALMLLENHSSSELLKTFIKLRKIALSTVIEQSHASVRHQVSAMVRCLITTVHLLHGCFISYKDYNNGLIWQQLEDIVNENAPPTLSKIDLRNMPLIEYIPDIIEHFRPKCCFTANKEWRKDLNADLQDWLRFTTDAVESGLRKSLESVSNIKGLHIVREEALKIEVPSNWIAMCTEINLPNAFNVWYNFFQNLLTNRAMDLISRKVASSVKVLQDSLTEVLEDVAKTEYDLRCYAWTEESADVSKTENVHIGLSMKTKGYSSSIIKLCEKMDGKCIEILNDASLYLYGREQEGTFLKLSFPLNHDRKYKSTEKLEKHMQVEYRKNSVEFINFLESYVIAETDRKCFVLKSLLCARMLQALLTLCPNFNRCCSCGSNTEELDKISSAFNKANLRFWQNWVEYVVSQTQELSSQLLGQVNILQLLTVLPKWDTIEIEEHIDEKTYNSTIKVPSQPSLALQQILTHLSNNLNNILPHTLPKQVHLQFIQKSTQVIFEQYETLLATKMNQKESLQFLFDVKFLTTFCVTRENLRLVQKSQEICDKLRANVDPFDLNVFYLYLQNNTKQSVIQSQVILGSLLPSSNQLASLGLLEKSKEQERDPSILALSVPSSASWFPLLPVTAPVQKTSVSINVQQKDQKSSPRTKSKLKKPTETSNTVRSGAAALFGAMATDWFS